MSSTSAIALSGMQAAQLSLQRHAHNLANLGTADVVAGGTLARTTRAEAPGPALATDLVGQLQAKNAFLANLAVFKTGDRMAGALLDAVG